MLINFDKLSRLNINLDSVTKKWKWFQLPMEHSFLRLSFYVHFIFNVTAVVNKCLLSFSFQRKLMLNFSMTASAIH